MSDKIIRVPPAWRERAFIDHAKYEEMYARSLRDPDGFWREQAQRIDWIRPFTKVKNVSWDPDNFFIKWFEDGTLNVSANCIDRHLPKRAKQTAIIWEADDPNEQPRHITYEELHREVRQSGPAIDQCCPGYPGKASCHHDRSPHVREPELTKQPTIWF